jgi:hypothetical protein
MGCANGAACGDAGRYAARYAGVLHRHNTTTGKTGGILARHNTKIGVATLVMGKTITLWAGTVMEVKNTPRGSFL